MAITGSESSYSGGKSSNQLKPSSTSSVSDIQNYLPLGDFTQYEAGSDEWIRARLASAYQKLKEQYEAIAASRGLSHSGITEADLAKAMEQERLAIESEAAELRLQQSEAEKQRQHETQLTDKQAKSQEKAAMYSGLGQIGAYGLLTPRGTTPGAGSTISSSWDKIKSSLSQTPDILSKMPSPSLPGGPLSKANLPAGESVSSLGNLTNTASPAQPSKWEALTSSLGQNLGASLAGTALGTLAAGGGDRTRSSALGGTYGALASALANPLQSGWGALTSSALPSYLMGNVKGNILSKKNIWKTIGAGALPFLSSLMGGK